MRPNNSLILRILGAAHIAVAVVLLPLCTLLSIFTLPIVVPALIWLAVLGFRLGQPKFKLRSVLRLTHIVLAPLGAGLAVYGLFALRAAKRSAEYGGGLLGAFGLIPIGMGLLVGTLSLISLFVSYTTDNRKRKGAEHDPGNEVEKTADGPCETA